MKIALVSESMPHYYNSGVGTVMKECLQAIEDYGHESLLIGPNFPGCRDHDGVWLPALTLARGYRSTFLSGAFLHSQIRAKLKDVDLVHIHSISALTFTVLDALAGMERRPKVILHLHTQVEEYLKRWGMSVWASLVNNHIARYADKVDLIIVPTAFFGDIAEVSYGLMQRPKVWTAPISIPENLEVQDKQELINSLKMCITVEPPPARIRPTSSP